MAADSGAGDSVELVVGARRPNRVRACSVLLALVLGAGCGAAVDVARSPTASTSTSLTDNRVGYVPVGSSRAPQSPEEALAQTVAGLSTVIRSATLGPKPSDPSLSTGTWLHIELAADGQMEADWEAALLLGAVADRTTRNGRLASVIKGSIVDYVPPDPSLEPAWYPTNDDVVAGQQFMPPGDDNAIKQNAADTLAQFGLQPETIEVLHPLDAALEVVATIPSPEAMNRQLAQLMSVLTGTPIHYEGVYLEVRLPDGSPIAKLSSAFREGRGSQWVRPDLEDILGGPPHG